MRNTILIVDDIEINREVLKGILCESYNIIEASDGNEAIQILSDINRVPCVVLLDIMMPGIDGYAVLEWMKNHSHTEHIPVLIITAMNDVENESKAINSGAVDFIPKPFNSDVIKARINQQVQLNQYRNNLEDLVMSKTEELSVLHQRILETLAAIVEHRNLESGLHVKRVQEFTRILVMHMLTKDIFRDELMRLGYREIISATILHDIGKVGISDSILLKPGKLTPEEFEEFKAHCAIGGEIIDIIAKDGKSVEKYLKHCKDIAMYHHERWDGTGYSGIMSGRDIPLSARILSVIDVYDALASKRCYKDAFPHERALGIISEGRGTQFDPDIIDCFMEISEEIKELAAQLTED